MGFVVEGLKKMPLKNCLVAYFFLHAEAFVILVFQSCSTWLQMNTWWVKPK